MLGGARSGKSAFAERLVREASARRAYVATAQAFDDEMQERIRRHREDRGDGWTTIEEPLDLAGALAKAAEGGAGATLVDCLTLWVTNLMMADCDCDRAADALLEGLPPGGTVVFVSNEVGGGIVPMDPMSRAFRDHAGRLHQALAARADEVYLVTAGLAQRLK